MAKRNMCCSGGVCPECEGCCICLCTRQLKKVLSSEARRLLLKQLA